MTLVLCILGLVIGFAFIIAASIMLESEDSALANVLLVGGILEICFGWIPLLGLRILKPQEALVLTLFGKYVGTIKGEGFYWINPFCSSFNPAANTKLNQSGDVNTVEDAVLNAAANANLNSKKLCNLKMSVISRNRTKEFNLWKLAPRCASHNTK